ncbi:MAG: hypothetical protein V7746_14105 [Halioglobus sp.]
MRRWLMWFFQRAVRAGSGVGGALGSGWLVENGDVTGRTTLFEFFIGPNLGAQANAAEVTVGIGVTPSYNNEVAMFTQLRGGLLVEASVGSQRYDFFHLTENNND